MKFLRFVSSLFFLVFMEQVLACASCGCSLNADWGTQGLSTQAGWSLDLRYDYLNQNQLWSGTNKISPVVAAGPEPWSDEGGCIRVAKLSSKKRGPLSTKSIAPNRSNVI